MVVENPENYKIPSDSKTKNKKITKGLFNHEVCIDNKEIRRRDME